MSHKSVLAFSAFVSAFFLSEFSALAVHEAGEVQRKDEKQPHAAVYVEHDVTDINIVKEGVVQLSAVILHMDKHRHKRVARDFKACDARFITD